MKSRSWDCALPNIVGLVISLVVLGCGDDGSKPDSDAGADAAWADDADGIPLEDASFPLVDCSSTPCECPPGNICSCELAGCELSCSGDCTAACLSDDCSLRCESGATCQLLSQGDRGSVTCQSGSYCVVSLGGADSKMVCEGGAQCLTSCMPGSANCDFDCQGDASCSQECQDTCSISCSETALQCAQQCSVAPEQCTGS